MNFRTPLIPVIIALAFVPALAEASTPLSSLGSATATNSFDNANFNQTWTWNTLTNGPGLYLNSNGTAAPATGGGQLLFEVYSQGVNSTSGAASVAAEIINEHSGTNSINYGLVVQADSGTSHNFGIVGYTMGTSAGDYGVLGDSIATSGANYGLYGLDNSPTGYAGYFDNTNGGYAAAFMGGNVGIGTATPQSLVHAYGGEVQVGSSGASCAAARGGAIRFSGSTLYYCDGSSTWQTLSTGSGSSQWTTSGSNIYYSTGNVGIGTASPRSGLAAAGVDTQVTIQNTNDSSGNLGAFVQNTYAALQLGMWNSSGSTISAIPANTQRTMFAMDETGKVGSATNTGGNPGASGVTFRNVLDDGSGNVGIGTASPNGRFDVEGGTMLLNASSSFGAGLLNIMFSSATNVPITLKQTNASATGTFLQFFDSGSNSLGQIVNNNNGTVGYQTSSDRRLKENIVPTTKGLSDLLKIQVSDFNFITDPKKTRMQGFVAQQVNDIYPEAVTAGSEDPKKKPWGLDYGRLTPLLVKAVQELKASNDDLKSSNDKLQARLTDDEATIATMKVKLGR